MGLGPWPVIVGGFLVILSPLVITAQRFLYPGKDRPQVVPRKGASISAFREKRVNVH